MFVLKIFVRVKLFGGCHLCSRATSATLVGGRGALPEDVRCILNTEPVMNIEEFRKNRIVGRVERDGGGAIAYWRIGGFRCYCIGRHRCVLEER